MFGFRGRGHATIGGKEGLNEDNAAPYLQVTGYLIPERSSNGPTRSDGEADAFSQACSQERLSRNPQDFVKKKKKGGKKAVPNCPPEEGERLTNRPGKTFYGRQ